MIGLFRRAAQRAAKTLQGVAQTLEALGDNSNDNQAEAGAEAAPPVFREKLEVRYTLERLVDLGELQGRGRGAFHRSHEAQAAGPHHHVAQEEGTSHFHVAEPEARHMHVHAPGRVLRRRRP